MIGIYKITNQITNKVYIGQSINIQYRWKQHKQQAKNNRKNNKLYQAMRKYGIENFLFEVIEQCKFSQQQLDNRQRYWIEYYNSYENGYNSTRGGQIEGSWAIYNPDDIRKLWDQGYSFKEIQEKIGCSKGIVQQRLQGYSDYNAITSHSRGAIKAIQDGKMNHLHNTPETMTAQQAKYFYTNKSVHQYNLNGEYIASYDSLSAAARATSPNKTSDQTNISHAIHHKDNQKIAYGYQWSTEKVDKMPPIATHLGKLVQCIETGQIFPSVREAANWCGLKSSSSIKDYCRGNNAYKSAGKHPQTGQKLHWRYIED